MPSSNSSGQKLSRLYYTQAVVPIIEAQYPGLTLSAGLIGPGSEVLGFDDEISTDHSWGPRVGIYLAQVDQAQLGDEIRQTLAFNLPFSFGGFPTHFQEAPATLGAG